MNKPCPACVYHDDCDGVDKPKQCIKSTHQPDECSRCGRSDGLVTETIRNSHGPNRKIKVCYCKTKGIPEKARRESTQPVGSEEALRLLDLIDKAVEGYVVEHQRIAEGNDEQGYSVKVWGSDRANIVAAHKSHIPLLRELIRKPKREIVEEVTICKHGTPSTRQCKWLECANQWQPIETAPRDGTRILIPAKCSGKAFYVATVCYIGGYEPGDVWYETATGMNHYSPGVWMPMPPEPTNEIEGG